jgi:hypothetical protein
MIQVENLELLKANELNEASDYEEAQKILDKIEDNKDISTIDLISSYLIRCEIHIQKGLYYEAFKLAEKAYERSMQFEKNILTLDSLILMAKAGFPMVEVKRLQEIIEEAEKHLKIFNTIENTMYEQRKAQVLYVKAQIEIVTYEPDKFRSSLELAKHSLTIQRKLGIKIDILQSLIALAIMLGFDYQIEKGINYAQEALKLAKSIKNRYYIGLSMKRLMLLYSLKGELDASLEYAQKSLSLFEEINNTIESARVLTQIGDKYMRKGEFKQSLNYLERSLILYEDLNFPGYKSVLISTLIEVAVFMSDLVSANNYFQQLKQLYDKHPSKWIDMTLRYSKALILKQSTRSKDRIESERIFKEVIKEFGDDIDFVDTFIHICDLLLIELRLSNDIEVLKEIDYYVNWLLKASEKSKSFWILGETYLLQAKLALVKLELTEARRLLTEGQKLAEKYNLTYLAKRISEEHDELLNELGEWEHYKKTTASIEQRLKLSRISEYVDLMAKKRVIEPKKYAHEIPIAILIIGEGGSPIFSQYFQEDWTFEDNLFGGFLTAINSFSDELFSEGLNRANFGEYTLIMDSLPPFLVSYLFKGQSYYAQQKLENFIDNFMKDRYLLKTFHEFNQVCREVELKNVPSLEPLIKEIFH